MLLPLPPLGLNFYPAIHVGLPPGSQSLPGTIGLHVEFRRKELSLALDVPRPGTHARFFVTGLSSAGRPIRDRVTSSISIPLSFVFHSEGSYRWASKQDLCVGAWAAWR